MARPKLLLFVDVVSPYVYLAFYVIQVSLAHSRTMLDTILQVFQNSLAFKDCDVEYVPVLLGAITKAVGNTSPLLIKSMTLVSCRQLLMLILMYR